MNLWLVVEPTHLKKLIKLDGFPQVGGDDFSRLVDDFPRWVDDFLRLVGIFSVGSLNYLLFSFSQKLHFSSLSIKYPENKIGMTDD